MKILKIILACILLLLGLTVLITFVLTAIYPDDIFNCFKVAFQLSIMILIVIIFLFVLAYCISLLLEDL